MTGRIASATRRTVGPTTTPTAGSMVRSRRLRSRFSFRLTTAVLGVLVASTALSACGSDSEPASGTSGNTEMESLTVQVAPLIGPSALLLGIDNGTFEAKNLKLETKPYAPDSSVPLVINGQTPIGFGGAGAIIAARSKGLPLKILAATATEGDADDTNSTAVMAAKASGVTSFKGLSGKRVGVNALGGDAQAHAANLIDEDGGDSASVKWQVIPFPGQTAAMKGDQVDAVLTAAPSIAPMLADGHKNLGPFSSSGYPAGVYFTSDSFLEKNPETVTSFLAALQESEDYADAHRDEALAKLAEVSSLSDEALETLPEVNWGQPMDPAVITNAATLMEKYGFIEKAPSSQDLLYSK